MWGGTDITPNAQKLRALVALLALRSNTPVQVPEIVDELWGDAPPGSAIPTLHTHIYNLRKLLANCASEDDSGEVLRTEQRGYVLRIPPDAVDVHRFDRLAQEARAALGRDDPERAADRCLEALALWRGAALAGVSTGPQLSAHVVRLEEARLHVLETKFEAQLRLGQHRDLVSELKETTRTHPTHEGFVRQLMVALDRCDRRAEAIAEYRRLRGLLHEQLGVEPSASLKRLHQELLVTSAAPDRAPSPSHLPRRLGDPPAQLPAAPADFVGRGEELDRCGRSLVGEGRGTGSCRVLVITGRPGMGKTALAIRAAHRLRPHFDDGQLFTDLRGSSRRPAEPHDVLGGFLRAIGAPVHHLPDGPDARAALWRANTAQRRLLIVFDDAASPDQLQPLLPASDRSAVIVTTRAERLDLPGSTTVAAVPLRVDEGAALLCALLDEPTAEGANLEQLVVLCGGVPLAIRSLAGLLRASCASLLHPVVLRLAPGRPESSTGRKEPCPR
ncbi:AfsR/SARP family transcriptional regulator [Gandjariella thermophila]|uniref:OmpR/PhoB-type domain-containing protein n=1 Tax=Gandjariella thermophila TaxID=1931992 RepID=A0A4D4JBH7_9PSEU|nr:AfsR/SARP family transcriptional regulator [Gandjariella thermophila]GDY31739.1 hypothetical protein GTS_33720 [Gandjariella thermophila]